MKKQLSIKYLFWVFTMTFSALCYSQSPGGVSTNLEFWTKANVEAYNDAGVTLATDNQTIQQWNDQSGNSLTLTSGAGPSYQDDVANRINFNPVTQWETSGTGNIAMGVGSALNLVGTTDHEVLFVGITPTSGNNQTILSANVSGGYQYRVSTGGHLQLLRTATALVIGGSTDTRDLSPHISGVSRSGNQFDVTLDGRNDGTNTVVADFGTGNFNVGNRAFNGAPNYENYEGELGELIVYSSSVSATERLQIQSYLALKYGITLDQTSPTNYLSSTGSVLWDATANAAYSSDVFGIASDLTSDLDQRVSKSMSSDAIITMALDNDFTALNGDAGRTTTHDNTLQSLILGNNNLGVTVDQTSELPTGTTYTTRMSREWLVSKTANFGQLINMKFTGYGTISRATYYLVKDADGDFTTGATEIGPLDANGEITGVNLANGEYLTIVAIDESPGGVDTTLELWVKADAEAYIDAGTTLANDGELIQQWNDQSINDLTPSSGSRPTYQDDAANRINFNPVTQWDTSGTGNLAMNTASTLNLGGTTDHEVMFVGITPTSSNQQTMLSANLAGGFQFRVGNTGQLQLLTGGTSLVAAGTTDLQDGLPHIGGVNRNGSQFNVSLDGAIDGTATSTPNFGFANINIGNRANGSPNYENHEGNIGEVIVYSSGLSATEKQKVQTYLALKYGITLNNATDYLASNGSTIWATDPVYNKSIFGIGKDQVSSLDQRVSKSVNTDAITTIALDNDFTSANTDIGRTTAHVNDKQFLILSNDGGVLTTQTTEVNTVAFPIRVTREWRVSASSFTQAVNLKFDGFNNTYYLLQDSDGDFSSGAGVLGQLSASGEITGVTLTDGTYLTLAVVDTNDSDNDGIQNWADADVNGDGVVDNETDTDGDGITDPAETANGTDPTNVDSDNDGMPDGADVDSGANSNTDTDGDGIQDGADIDHTTATDPDTDGDGIIDIVDPYHNTDPIDTDGDGIHDGADVDPTGTGTPLNGQDSDGDGIHDTADSDDSPNDGTTDVGNTDSDGDGIDDAYDPDVDTDGDGIQDWADADVDGDGTVDNGVDTDGDGITDAAETANGTDPINMDSDNDGIPDGADVDSGANSNTDTDGDGVQDGGDVDHTTATNNADTDGDGIIDIVDPLDNNSTVDTDGDGIPDIADVDPTGTGTPLNGSDSDGDGISDAADSDDSPNDGTTDVGNTDSDGDGIDDAYDPQDNSDTDGDGIENWADADVDGDGTVDNGVDTDGDGITDAAETANGTDPINMDSDNDGIPDGADVDSGANSNTDTDGDGVQDGGDVDHTTATNNTDTDGDGIIDIVDPLDNNSTVDTDGDGIPDIADVDPTGTGTPLNGSDSDGDGISDAADSDDSPNDGTTDVGNTDSDGDGIDDAYDPQDNSDTDGDGIENWADADVDGDGTVDNGVDTDGDGITDAAETANGTDPINMDSDNDGIPDGADVDSGANSNTDTDGDGVQDGGDVDHTTATNNTDTDGDGIIDIVDPLDNNSTVDTDGDGIPDIADVDPTGTGTPLNGSDSDGDGISDAADSDDSPNDGTTDVGNTDSDGDGIDDAYDPQDNSDTDGDGIENWADADVDGDGTVDNGVDTDGDGITDAAETANGTDPINMDSDNDGIPDGADVDSGANSNTDTDGDGVQDGGDVDHTTATNNTDTDGDGIIDIVDPLDNNSTVDTDGDGIPDIADVDPTGTGTPLNGSDSDGDGISDAADADDSPNDGTTDVGNTDSDGDGIDDAYDPQDNSDTDGDGIENWADADVDGDGTVDNGVDTDGDGITDAAETANGTDPINMDSDGDGIPDGADVDSGANSNTDTDGDGVQDGGDVDHTTATNNTDTDGDGIIDIVDPLDNTDPIDTDGDGIPDVADVDPTGTGTPLNGSDSDGDGISDAADSDDSPNDGTTDVGNTDSDGNGIDDAYDPNVLSTNEVSLSGSEVKLYPNPVQDVLNIRFATSINKANVIIYNIAGQKVYQAVLNNMVGNEAIIDISKMSSGLYLIKITTDEGFITKRLEKK